MSVLLLLARLPSRLGAGARQAGRWFRAWWEEPRNRWFVLALVVAFGLRLAWAFWATRTPSDVYSDTARFLALADRFGHGHTEQINGETSAFTPPGYAMFLAPLAFVARSGWFSLSFAASLANVALGTFTVGGAGVLAGRWLGAGTRNVTAWLLALAPAQIYLTSAALSETLFTALVIAILLAATAVAARHGTHPPAGLLVALGLLIGFAALVRFPGALLIVTPALAVRALRGTWDGALRVTGWLLLGTVVALLPWTFRNATQVGVLTPTSTNSVAFLCAGHHDGATGEIPFDGPPECYQGSPFERPSDEAEWYRETGREAVGWALSHPVETAQISAWITFDTMKDDSGALDAAQDFNRQPVAGERVVGLLNHLADGWHWAVLGLAAAGLVLLPSCRRALPLWATAALMLVIAWAGVGQTRFHHPFMPILAAFAAATLVAAAVGGRTDPAPVGVGGREAPSV